MEVIPRVHQVIARVPFLRISTILISAIAKKFGRYPVYATAKPCKVALRWQMVTAQRR